MAASPFNCMTLAATGGTLTAINLAFNTESVRPLQPQPRGGRYTAASPPCRN